MLCRRTSTTGANPSTTSRPTTWTPPAWTRSGCWASRGCRMRTSFDYRGRTARPRMRHVQHGQLLRMCAAARASSVQPEDFMEPANWNCNDPNLGQHRRLHRHRRAWRRRSTGWWAWRRRRRACGCGPPTAGSMSSGTTAASTPTDIRLQADRLRVLPHLAGRQLGSALRLLGGQRSGERPVADDRRISTWSTVSSPSVERGQRRSTWTRFRWEPIPAWRSFPTGPRVLDDPRLRGPGRGHAGSGGQRSRGTCCRVRPDIRDSDGIVIPEFQGLVPWETYPDALDTFFAVTYRRRPIRPTGSWRSVGTKYYEYVDRDIHNGFIYFYSVTATDHDSAACGQRAEDYPTCRWARAWSAIPGRRSATPCPARRPRRPRSGNNSASNIYVYPEPGHPGRPGRIPGAVPERRRPHGCAGDVHQPAAGPQHDPDLHGQR